MRIDIHHHFDGWSHERKLDRILSILARIEKKEAEIMTKQTDLEAAVTAETTVEASAVTLLNGLAQQLKDALASSTPDAAVQAVIDNMTTSSTALGAAVAANTQPTP